MAYTTILFLTFFICNGQLLANITNYRSTCPDIYKQTFRGYLPKGNSTAGAFTEIEDAHILKKCIVQCCVSLECNVAFMSDSRCYHIACENNELCTPALSQDADVVDQIAMVLVRPVPPAKSWAEILDEAAHKNNPSREKEELFSILDDSRQYDSNYKSIKTPDSLDNEYSSACSVGISTTCMANEECVQNFPKSRAGTCKCKAGFLKNNNGVCILSGEVKDVTESTPLNETSAITKKHLTVTAVSKTVKLPESEVSLTAVVDPPAQETEKYQYDWTSLQQPSGSAAIKHQNGDQVHLSKLSAGLYTFKVTVSNDYAYGETFVNVTVLPPSRINTPPQIVITPANQTIKLPNTGAVLDASSTTDDNGIVSYHWELQQGPLGYDPHLTDTSTLQLNDLTRPGNYTFKLTVMDTDKATNSSTANITVLKVTDYPPEANAGQDHLIYLPHNQITLNGNASTDDHAITTWEWTKSAGDANKAVDMQDTRTPYLKLSNLEEGMYTFILKVTDSANQSSTAQVHVFVKPPTNQPPIAEAGPNITISLPQTWVVVDASKSKDDNKIEAFYWEEVEGPSAVNFVDANSSVTNVTGLTKGRYIFKVSVRDDNNNTASDLVFVTVDQNKNQKPTANAGGNFEVVLPRNVIFVNGSKSSDDWAIVKWKWVRDDSSAATGNFAEGSDATPILMVTDAVAGKYIFNLTVFDEQGLSDTDSVTVLVKKDPKLYYLIELVIDSTINQITEVQYNTIKGKLSLLVKDGTKLHVRSIKPRIANNKAVIDFYVENSDGTLVNANEAVEYLREKLRVDQSLLGFSVLQLQTVICQNNCSGHGVCDEQSRYCICDTFWMQDMFKVYFGSFEDSDCQWSVLYVVLGATCFTIALIGSLCGLLYLCCSWCRKRRLNSKPTSYKLIEDADELPAYSRKGSDSDTDSDVVFESRNKSARFNIEPRNGHKPNRNGFVKMGRRLKT